MGTAECRDGYDVIEEIAKLQWCSGKVALVGNPWLAIVKWFIASLKVPHLACIAPKKAPSISIARRFLDAVVSLQDLLHLYQPIFLVNHLCSYFYSMTKY